ncbi:hypothetical protein ABW17_08235 [Mycobacterium nebraskense]|nr:hypothetical protein ABW17_08235 [Mycobacterium nebraskense]
MHDNGLMARLAYIWKQVVDTPLFAENDLALEVGGGDDAITVIRTANALLQLQRRIPRRPPRNIVLCCPRRMAFL